MKIDLEILRLRLVLWNTRYLYWTPLHSPIEKLLDLASGKKETRKGSDGVDLKELTKMQAAARLEGRQALQDGKPVIWVHGVPYADPGVVGREGDE